MHQTSLTSEPIVTDPGFNYVCAYFIFFVKVMESVSNDAFCNAFTVLQMVVIFWLTQPLWTHYTRFDT